MTRLRHVLGVLLVAIVATSGPMRGLCFMPGTGEAGPRDAHACCKKGWTARPPECCMASAPDEEPARAVKVAMLALPGAIGSIEARRSLPPPAVHDAFRSNDRSHSPPGLQPLRI